MRDVSDEALLAAMAGGDQDAAAVFIGRFQRRVFGFAVTMLGDRAVAEEVAQEAFVRAWRHGAAYDGRLGSVPTWLLAITRNLAIDVLRTRRRRLTEEPLDSSLASFVASAGDLPEEHAVRRDEFSRVSAALAALPEPQRRAVLLASFGGFTAREVGEVDRIPLGTAKTRIRDGLLRLRSLVGDPEVRS